MVDWMSLWCLRCVQKSNMCLGMGFSFLSYICFDAVLSLCFHATLRFLWLEYSHTTWWEQWMTQGLNLQFKLLFLCGYFKYYTLQYLWADKMQGEMITEVSFLTGQVSLFCCCQWLTNYLLINANYTTCTLFCNWLCQHCHSNGLMMSRELALHTNVRLPSSSLRGQLNVTMAAGSSKKEKNVMWKGWRYK